MDPLRAQIAELIALRHSASALQRVRRRRSRQAVSGGLHTPFRGRGMEYAESRPYAVGDDARHVDWRVSARRGELHSKLFHPERDRVSAIVYDAAATMCFGSRACLKSVQAARLAALFAWSAAAAGDRIAGISTHTKCIAVPPGRGERGALRLLGHVQRWQPDVTAPERQSCDLLRALGVLERGLRSGAHILLLLDPRSLDSAALSRLRAWSRQHDLLICLLADPLEIEPLPEGRYPLLSSAATPQWWGGGQLQELLHAPLKSAGDRLAGSGLVWRVVRTDDDPVTVLREMISGRATGPEFRR